MRAAVGEMMAEMDKSGDGEVDFVEFLAWWKIAGEGEGGGMKKALKE